jgi:hypothetical protein
MGYFFNRRDAVSKCVLYVYNIYDLVLRKDKLDRGISYRQLAYGLREVFLEGRK